MAAPPSRKSTLDFLRGEGREGGCGRLVGGAVGIIWSDLPVGSGEDVMGAGGKREVIAPGFLESSVVMRVIEASEGRAAAPAPCRCRFCLRARKEEKFSIQSLSFN